MAESSPTISDLRWAIRGRVLHALSTARRSSAHNATDLSVPSRTGEIANCSRWCLRGRPASTVHSLAVLAILLIFFYFPEANTLVIPTPPVLYGWSVFLFLLVILRIF